MAMKNESPSAFHLAVQAFIKKENMLNPSEEVICAVSGGVDSMALATILDDLGYAIQLAHFNFKLRGIESGDDQSFIENWAKTRNIPLHLNSIPNPDYWKNGIKEKNIQLKARQLRYDWFEELRIETGIKKLATGHHADDQAETILMHFLRGSGLAGLRGILPNSREIIRPLLAFSKTEIVEFARQHVGNWRSDSSNETDSYRRNKIRHQLWPVLQSISPGFDQVILRNAERIRLAEMEVKNRFEYLFSTFLLEDNGGVQTFSWGEIRGHKSGKFFISELLNQLGFPFQRLDELWKNEFSEESKTWNSANSITLEIKDSNLFVQKRNSQIKKSVAIKNLEMENILIPDLGTIRLFKTNQPPESFEKANSQCWVEERKLKFPLAFTPWQVGDRIKPLGMKNKEKLVSDLLTDLGLSKLEKSQVWVLRNGDNELIWVVGYRSSEQFKISTVAKPLVCFSITN